MMYKALEHIEHKERMEMRQYSDLEDRGIILASFFVNIKEPEEMKLLNIFVNIGVSKSGRGTIVTKATRLDGVGINS